MKLVVDSNIIFSALISPNGKTAELIFLKNVELYSTRTLEIELFEHKMELIKKSGFSESEFDSICFFILKKIYFVETIELVYFEEQAAKICPDKDDVAFFALCLAKGIPLWSNDKLLKNQNVVKVISTSEIVKMFS
jgi:predicted nucleic acid-binding protein